MTGYRHHIHMTESQDRRNLSVNGSITIKVGISAFKVHIFCEIFTLLLFYVVPVKSKVKILQNCVAFLEYLYELYIQDRLGTYNFGH